MKACMFYITVFCLMFGFTDMILAKEAIAGDDANEVKAVESAVGDANGVVADANSFEEDALKDIRDKLVSLQKQGERQGREWTRRRFDKIRIAEEVEEQIVEELTLIRSVAFEEEATKTIAVIDSIMESRKARLAELVETLRERAADERREEQGTRGGRSDRRRRDRRER